MKMFGRFVSSVCSIAVSVTASLAADENWMIDFEAAKEKAAKENKSLLIDFTGSDWCGWCIKLKKEVFQHDEFNKGVADDFVLVELDYPRDKSKMSPETLAQNEKLKDEYAIRGYPTILLADAKGRPFAKTGYQAGGPAKYVESLGALLEIRKKRDAAFEEASKLEGVEKAESLITGIKAMPLDNAMVAGFYKDEVEQIKASDPDDKTGFVKGIETGRKYAEFEKSLAAFGSKRDHVGALGLIEKTLEAGEFEGEAKQQITMIRGFVLAELGDFEKALASIDEAKKIAPESKIAAQTDMIKQRITAMKEKKEAE